MSAWIKIEKSLNDDPRVIRMAAKLCNADVTLALRSRTLVIGALVRFWIFADTHIRNDNTLDLGKDEVDGLVGLPGFCDLMPSDWLRIIDENTLELPDFQQHNGVEAKKRALTQKRVQKHRNAPVTLKALPDQDRDQDHKKGAKAPPVAEEIFDPSSVPNLNIEAWSLWVEHRKEIKKPIRPHSMRDAAEQLAKLNGTQLLEVKRARAAGWQGLHPEKPTAQQKPAKDVYAGAV